MRILWITPEPPDPPRNGVRVKSYNIIETLKYQHEFHVVYYGKENDNYTSKNVRTHKLDDVELKSTRKFKNSISIKNSNEYEFFRKISSIEYDLIVLDTIKLYHLINHPIINHSKLVFYLTDSYTLTLRDRRKYLVESSKKMYVKNYMKYLFYTWVEKNIIKSSRRVLVVSKYDKEYLRNKFGCGKKDNIIVVPNGVNTDYYNLEPSEKLNNSIGYIGSMGEGSVYCLWFLKNVFPIVVKSNPDIKFYIIGRGPSNELIEYSAKYNNVIITGEVDDIREYATLCDIIVSPVLKTHGILNKVLESFSMGKPVVGTNMSFNGIEYGEDGIHYISCKDENEMANNILDLLKNEEMIRDIGKNAKELVNNYYTWKNIFGDLFERL